LVTLALLSCTLAPLSGCKRGAPQVAPAETPTIPVAKAKHRQVTFYVEYTGRTNAKDNVTIQPRVTGFLKEIPFKEGAHVKKDDLLFVIDPRPYEAQLAAAKGQLKSAKASLEYATATNERFKALAKKEPGAVSERELDQYRALEEQAKANLSIAEANLASATLNLEWTRVLSPIDGYVSRYFLTEGNLVNQDVTQLTTIVSMDPMYAYFDMDEPTFLRLSKAFSEGKIVPVKQNLEGHPAQVAGAVALLGTPPGQGSLLGLSARIAEESIVEIPVELSLPGEDGYPHKGVISFVDNQVNPATGSISVRGTFPNPKPKVGRQLMVPGMFVRIRLPVGQPQDALLVIDRAVTSDQGLKYVYVLDKDNKAQSRRVTTGPLQDDGLRVILDGLKKDDWVVVGGLQQVRPRMLVQPDYVTMPTLNTPADRETPPPGAVDVPAGKGKGKGKG
jgi:multidrug efflux system membrane fusion protein